MFNNAVSAINKYYVTLYSDLKMVLRAKTVVFAIKKLKNEKFSFKKSQSSGWKRETQNVGIKKGKCSV